MRKSSSAAVQAHRRAAAALGCRVKSGYAVVVMLAGPAEQPTAIAREIVELSDRDVAESRQPYHDGFGTAQQDTREIARRVRIVERSAQKSVAALLDAWSAKLPSTPTDGQPSDVRAALVVGSLIDPQQVGNPHIRAHANEGRLFRTVLEGALRAHGIDCDVVVEKHLAARAVTDLGRSDGEIRRAVAAFGKAIGGPWRADEKAAATAAWLALRQRSTGRSLQN
jgi:hypothetical protein